MITKSKVLIALCASTLSVQNVKSIEPCTSAAIIFAVSSFGLLVYAGYKDGAFGSLSDPHNCTKPGHANEEWTVIAASRENTYEGDVTGIVCLESKSVIMIAKDNQGSTIPYFEATKAYPI